MGMNEIVQTTTRFLVLVSCATMGVTCQPRQEVVRQWFKGNLHTHSFWSDGDEYPEMIMEWYKSNGYHFVALSDHNTLAEGEKWIKVPDSRMYEDGFQQYLARYGEDWVTYRVDSGRTVVKLKTFEEYKQRFEDETFLILPSEEVTDRYHDKPVHINATNIERKIPPQGGNSVLDVMQRNIDAILEQREEMGVPMFPHINHPNFFYGVSVADMIGLQGERFFEVYNGHPMVHNYGDSLHPDTETMWDMINIAYANRDQPLMLGLATDDSHNYHQFGAAYSNAGRGWVMVQADSLTPSSLIRAMEQGSFYATTGVTLDELTFNGNRITIRVRPEPGVRYEIRFIGATKADQRPVILKVMQGTEAEFPVNEDLMFVRAKVISDRLKPNPFQEGDYEVAWTQPVVHP